MGILKKLMMSDEEYFWRDANARSQGFSRIVDAQIANENDLLAWQPIRPDDENATIVSHSPAPAKG